MANPLKKLASQTAIYGLGSILPRFINYAFSFVLTYIFKEPTQLAPNAEFFAYISFFNILFFVYCSYSNFGGSNDSFNIYLWTKEVFRTPRPKARPTAMI